MTRRHVGIDLAKRTMEARILEGAKIERHGLATDEKGQNILALLLRGSDVVGYEVSGCGNRLAMALQKEAGRQAAAVNRPHALYGQVRIIDVTKKGSQDSTGRKARHGELPPPLAGYASILEEQQELFERQLEDAEEKAAEQARRHELAPYGMSIPGIGIAAVILAYVGGREPV
ncbi:MAG: hypothetical protein LBD58_08535 [Treponema sp.]|jgi:hypothetical protein|nr:hypothetical protein [Treponema sp.]